MLLFIASTILLVVLVVGIVLYFFHVVKRYNLSYNNKNNSNEKEKQHDRPLYPNGPPQRFFWGNALDFPDVRKGHHIDTKMMEWAMEYGTVYSVRIPIVGTMIVCADPDLAKHITVKKNFPKSPTYRTFEPIFGSKSIVVSEGTDWMHKRRTFNPGFAPSFLKDMVTVMCDKCHRLVISLDADINAGTVTPTLNRMQTFTADVIVQIAFGEDWGITTTGDAQHPARLYLTELMELTSCVGNDPMVKLFGFKMKRRIREITSQLDSMFREVLEKRLVDANQRDAGVDASVQTPMKDILSIAIDQVKQNDGTVTEEDKISILHQMKTFYTAGHDTTASIIAWALWLFSKNSLPLDKLRLELSAKGIWNNDQRPTYEQLQDCPYLEAVVHETLRLYPPASTARYTHDISEQYGGYTIGGAILYVNAYVMHRHPMNFERPNEFVPERFMENTKTKDIYSKFIPFSKGQRDCLGKYFAMLEAKLAISRLVLRYDFQCVDPNEDIGYQVTSIPKGGAKVKLSFRNNST